MKLFRYLIAVVALVLSMGAFAEETQKYDKLYILDGYFFSEIPVDMSLLDGMISIQTANGVKAFGMTLKEPLPEEAKKYAIPKPPAPSWKEQGSTGFHWSTTPNSRNTSEPTVIR